MPWRICLTECLLFADVDHVYVHWMSWGLLLFLGVRKPSEVGLPFFRSGPCRPCQRRLLQDLQGAMVTKLVGRVKMRKCILAIYKHMHSRILCLEDKINIQVRISCTQGKYTKEDIGSVGN